MCRLVSPISTPLGWPQDTHADQEDDKDSSKVEQPNCVVAHDQRHHQRAQPVDIVLARGSLRWRIVWAVWWPWAGSHGRLGINTLHKHTSFHMMELQCPCSPQASVHTWCSMLGPGCLVLLVCSPAVCLCWWLGGMFIVSRSAGTVSVYMQRAVGVTRLTRILRERFPYYKDEVYYYTFGNITTTARAKSSVSREHYTVPRSRLANRL